jgi:hypothetical protein
MQHKLKIPQGGWNGGKCPYDNEALSIGLGLTFICPKCDRKYRKVAPLSLKEVIS